MNDNAKICPAAVIFDMDGLMLDTESPVIPLWVKAGKSLGWDISPEMAMRAIGIDWKTTETLFLDKYGADFPWNEIWETLRREIHEEFEKGIAHKKGLIFLLDHLSSLNIPLAVATSTHRKRAAWMLQKAGILERFAVLVCGDDIIRGKPSPDIFLKAAQDLGKPPSECVGFEDSPAGLKGLHAAGIRSVFIKDLIEPQPEILATVWFRCADLAEAAELFGR